MIPVAKILKSFGTDGGLLVSSGVELEELDIKEPVFIVFDGLRVPFFIQALEAKGSRYILHLNDISNLADAEEVVGREIFADVETEEDDEADFTGWQVLDHGTPVGEVSGEEPIPGNPCLYLRRPGGDEVLIPLHPDFVEGVDRERKKLLLNLPEGLL
ncbi:MAG: hypothetical protein J5771_01260 [Bacteroidales bacterium]|nr:hypothetical protein [Bacteroidales bacterium]